MMGHIQCAVLHCIGLQASGTKHGTGAISDGSATGRRRRGGGGSVDYLSQAPNHASALRERKELALTKANKSDHMHVEVKSPNKLKQCHI